MGTLMINSVQLTIKFVRADRYSLNYIDAQQLIT